MGQYLYTYLLCDADVRVFNSQTQLDAIDILAHLEKQGVYYPEIFEVDATEGLAIKLKESVFAEQLLPFLNDFYKEFYPESRSDTESAIISALRGLPPDKWLALAQEQKHYDFMYVGAIDGYTMRGLGKSNETVFVRCGGIALTSEGKVMTEGIDQHLQFFGSCMRAKFSSHPIAKALNVTIYG